MKLRNKVALITGGSSGIGKATAELFAAEGAVVAVVAGSSLAKAEAVAAPITKGGGQAKAFVADVRSVSAIRELVNSVTDVCGPIDILMNSAGIYLPNVIGETTEAEYDRMLDINLKGTFFVINAVVPGMKERRYGKIINVASISAYRGAPSYSLYCTVKAAIVMLTRTLATDLAPYDINVNAIAPGNTATPLNEKTRTDPAFADLMAAKATATPSNRTYSPPEEMAKAALFLASDDVRAMHGSTILLDEGASAGAFWAK
ncbi:MAG: SDR family oxidoreductase [Deltaproteobacteria bacterium]|jgi:3-oxoacyl-[acyl-carrier protein] reductase|nr:SDR family oxidoreductase [Deltaproteobacteria bacterium]